MSLAVAQFPIHRITWGIWSYAMNGFISSVSKKDEFETWNDGKNFMEQQYGLKAIAKQLLEVRPKKKYVYPNLVPEDV